MHAIVTEHDKMMIEIMEFAKVIVGVAEMRDISVNIRADAILMAEQIFHKLIMNKMIEKCAAASTPSNN